MRTSKQMWVASLAAAVWGLPGAGARAGQIVNGNFDQGLTGWSWDVKQGGEGVHNTYGDVSIVDLTGAEPPGDAHAAAMSAWSYAEYDRSPGAAKVAVALEQSVNAIPSTRLQLQWGMGFEYLLFSSAFATLRATVAVRDLTNGAYFVETLYAGQVEPPPDNPGISILGYHPLQWRCLNLAEAGVAVGDDIHLSVQFSATVETDAFGEAGEAFGALYVDHLRLGRCLIPVEPVPAVIETTSVEEPPSDGRADDE